MIEDGDYGLGSVIESVYTKSDRIDNDFKIITEDLKYSLTQPRKNISFIIHTFRKRSLRKIPIIIERDERKQKLNKSEEQRDKSSSTRNTNRYDRDSYEKNNNYFDNVENQNNDINREHYENEVSSRTPLGDIIERLIQSARYSSQMSIPKYKFPIPNDDEDTITVKVLKRILWEFGGNSFSRPELSVVLRKLGIPDDERAMINLNDFIEYCYSIPTTDINTLWKSKNDKIDYPFVKNTVVNRGYHNKGFKQSNWPIEALDSEDERWVLDSSTYQKSGKSLSSSDGSDDTSGETEMHALIQSEIKVKDSPGNIRSRKRKYKGRKSLESNTDTFLLENQRGDMIRKSKVSKVDKYKRRSYTETIPSICGDHMYLYTKLPRRDKSLDTSSTSTSF